MLKLYTKLIAWAMISIFAWALPISAYALNSPYYGTATWLSSGAITATTTNLADQTGLYVTGVELICNVSAAGTSTIQFKLQGKDLISGNYYDVAATSANTGGTGIYRVLVGANVFSVAATTTAVSVNTYVPYTWRLQIVKGDTSSWTLSCGYTMYSSS